MENLEEISDLSKNKLATFLGMLATLQSGDVSSKLHDMANKSKYQTMSKKVSSGKYGKMSPKLEKLVRKNLNKGK